MKRIIQTHCGFTLVEMVMVIAITGIIAGMVAVFIRAPVQSYFDMESRAGLTDAADTASRRIARDVRLALPNSIRTANPNCVEFLPTISGGRYRAEGPGNVLNFNTAPGVDFNVDVLGVMPVTATPPAANDHMVIYNLGIPGADAYAGNTRTTIAGVNVDGGGNITSIRLPAGTLFPFESPGKRFHVIPNAERAVSYVCVGAGVDAAGNGTGTLFRVSNYGFISPAPAACQATPAGTPVLVNNVSACAFNYGQLVNQRNGLVTMQLSLTRHNETVNLIQEVHVNNVP